MSDIIKEHYALIFKLSNSDQFGHGGQKRAYQVESLVRQYYEVENLYFDHNHPNIYPRKAKAKAYFNFFKNKWYKTLLTDYRRISWFNNEVCRIDILNEFLKKNEELIKGAKVILWEATFPYYLYLPLMLKQYTDKKIIACPQNLESLVKGQHINWYSNLKALRLDQEIRSLKECDFVFTIGEEEQWLLNLFDIPAKLLPYYPSDKNLESLLDVRWYRQNITDQSEDYFFILGSAINPPTKAAMIELLTFIRKNTSENKYKFILAGFGTEELQTEFESNNIKIEGRIEKLMLEEHLKKCKAVLVPQGFSTGALTRINELLIAGIPVFCDEGTARSYKRSNGLYVYSDHKHLMELLNRKISIPQVPLSPANEIKAFLNVINL